MITNSIKFKIVLSIDWRAKEEILKRETLGATGGVGGGRGTPYDRLYGEAPPERYKKGYRKIMFFSVF